MIRWSNDRRRILRLRRRVMVKRGGDWFNGEIIFGNIKFTNEFT
jgi:hypothetical protein